MGPLFVGFIRCPIDEHFLSRQGHALLAEDIGCRQMGRIARSQGQAAACRCQGTADLGFPFSFIIILCLLGPDEDAHSGTEDAGRLDLGIGRRR